VQGCAPASDSESFNPLFFTLKMKDNTTASTVNSLAQVSGQIDSSGQPAGSCVRGKVGFDVPPGETPGTLIFEADGFGQPVQWSVS
jgi:hypothetical protein